MKKIPLTQNQVALVDDVDYKELSEYKWYASYRKSTNSFCATRWSPIEKGKRHLIFMHRQILGLEYGDKRQADHKNHNTLDNRRCNIRICSCRQNHMNQKVRRNSKSIFKGICWDKANKKWIVHIRINGILKHLGRFVEERDAARAYNKAAKKYFGKFAYLNKIT